MLVDMTGLPALARVIERQGRIMNYSWYEEQYGENAAEMYLQDMMLQTGDAFEVWMTIVGTATDLAEVGIRAAISRNALERAGMALEDELRTLLSKGLKNNADNILAKAAGSADNYGDKIIGCLRDLAANSFSADTPVMTDHGEVPISEIKVGDRVLAYNTETGELSYDRVTDVLVHTDPVIEHLTIDDEMLTTTAEYHFVTQERG
jgi:hypothetical protein